MFDLRLRQVVPHVRWIDNFSKILPRQIPTQDLKTYHSCLWTVEALRPVSEELPADMYDSRRPALPVNPRICSVALQDCILAMEYDTDLKLWDTSVTRDLCRVPLDDSIPVRDRDEPTIETIPVSVEGMNVSSSIGLITKLQNLCREYTLPDETIDRYCIINVDINIYIRSLKVYLF